MLVGVRRRTLEVALRRLRASLRVGSVVRCRKVCRLGTGTDSSADDSNTATATRAQTHHAIDGGIVELELLLMSSATDLYKHSVSASLRVT